MRFYKCGVLALAGMLCMLASSASRAQWVAGSVTWDMTAIVNNVQGSGYSAITGNNAATLITGCSDNTLGYADVQITFLCPFTWMGAQGQSPTKNVSINGSLSGSYSGISPQTDSIQLLNLTASFAQFGNPFNKPFNLGPILQIQAGTPMAVAGVGVYQIYSQEQLTPGSAGSLTTYFTFQ